MIIGVLVFIIVFLLLVVAFFYNLYKQQLKETDYFYTLYHKALKELYKNNKDGV